MVPVVSGTYRLQRSFLSLKSSSRKRIATQRLGFSWQKQEEEEEAAAAAVCCFQSRFANESSEGQKRRNGRRRRRRRPSSSFPPPPRLGLNTAIIEHDLGLYIERESQKRPSQRPSGLWAELWLNTANIEHKHGKGYTRQVGMPGASGFPIGPWW
jgi:hypothetical protein